MAKMYVQFALLAFSLGLFAYGGFTVVGSKPHTVDLGAQTVGGYAVFDVSDKKGDPLLTIEYACHPDGLSGKGDFQRETSARYLGEQFDLPVLSGNVNRHEIYRICRTGRYVAPLIQGQERYARFHVEPGEESREFTRKVPAEPDFSSSDALKDGVLEIFGCFSDTSVNSNSYSELVFDLGKPVGISDILLLPTNGGVGWPGNLITIEVSDDRERWAVLRKFDDLPRRETKVDARTVVGATHARYLRLSATKLGPAWLDSNYNLQFGKIVVNFE